MLIKEVIECVPCVLYVGTLIVLAIVITYYGLKYNKEEREKKENELNTIKYEREIIKIVDELFDQHCNVMIKGHLKTLDKLKEIQRRFNVIISIHKSEINEYNKKVDLIAESLSRQNLILDAIIEKIENQNLEN